MSVNNKTTAKKAAASAQPSTPAPALPDRSSTATPSRLDQLEQLITREGGASITEMAEATGWQNHSIRGALAGALKKRGLVIKSEKTDGVRRYSVKTVA